jgi:hypothetical protein
MRTRGRARVQLNASLRFATDMKAQLRTRAGLSLKTSHRYPFTRRLGGTHAQCGCFGEERITAPYWKQTTIPRTSQLCFKHLEGHEFKSQTREMRA